MKEKIINTKNILKIIMLVLIIFSTIKSCSKAVDYQPEIEEKLTILENKGVIPTGFTQWVFNTSTYKTDLISNCKNSSRLGYFFLKTGTTGSYNNKFIISFSSTDPQTNYSNSSNNSFYHYWNFNMFVYNVSATSYSNSTQGGISMQNVVIEYAYTTININTRELVLNAGEEYGELYLSDNLEFTPYNNEIVSTNVNAIKNIYRYSVVSLGMIEGYLDDQRFNYVELLQNNNIVANMTYNNISKRLSNSYNMEIESNDNGDIIIVNNWVLYLDELYTLNIYSGGENVSKTNYEDIQTYYYIFLRANAQISNGTIINYGSGERVYNTKQRKRYNKQHK